MLSSLLNRCDSLERRERDDHGTIHIPEYSSYNPVSPSTSPLSTTMDKLDLRIIARRKEDA